MKKIIAALVPMLLFISVYAQSVECYPTHWFTGMQWNKVQLILRSTDPAFSQSAVEVQYPGVSLKARHTVANGKYLILDLLISPQARAGEVLIQTRLNNIRTTHRWQLKPRRAGRGTAFAQGVNASDLIYLVMPDRFSNGDTGNDAFENLQDKQSDRTDVLLRHGGDLKGIQNHIPYLKDLGMTTLWMTPVIENNMPLNKEAAGWMSGYHGYWFTNQYRVDPRLGGNEAYQQLSDALHAQGMKLIQDAVYNHIGSQHWIAVDPPAADWINQWNTYTGSNHRDEAIFATNSSSKDRKQMLDGWFVPHLPDVNQRNPYVANYLIQHAIWSTEEFGVDGWRVDTYKYCDEPFLNRINEALTREYPKLTIFGEAWTNTVTGSAYFTQNNIQAGFKHNATGVTDFPLNGAIMASLNQAFGWTEGVNQLYMTLAQDILYKDAGNNCIFLDNHDMNRFYSMAGERMDKYKQGIGLLLTLRGIPQLYYGTEVLMKNYKNPSDAMVRLDFPGGFPGDPVNKFEASGRTAQEQEAFTYVQKLALYRKQSPALTRGKTMQYLPADGLYVYFRYTQDQTVMCVLNTTDKSREVNLSDYTERTSQFTHARNVLTQEKTGQQFTVAPQTMLILELVK